MSDADWRRHYIEDAGDEAYRRAFGTYGPARAVTERAKAMNIAASYVAAADYEAHRAKSALTHPE